MPGFDASAPTTLLRDVLAGLSRPQKEIAGKYLWDEAGSALFDRICASPGYYPTRREAAILRREAGTVADLVGPGASLVEFGSGASHKTRILLDALAAPRRYVAIDISGAFLAAACARIARDYPELEVVPVCADYSQALQLPALSRTDQPRADQPRADQTRADQTRAGQTGAGQTGAGQTGAGQTGADQPGPVLGFCPGMTMGNLPEAELVGLLARAREALGSGWFLLSADGNAEPSSLQQAYADPAGLMAALHANLLVRLVRELDTDLDPDAFRHEARVLDAPLRVEAHLVARRAAAFQVAGQRAAFAAGESIHTDTSFKHGPAELQALAVRAGWTPVRAWADAEGAVCVHLLRG